MAFRLIALLLVVVSVASAEPGRIVDGSPTTIEEFPYIAAYTYTYPGPGITVQRCVGAILSSFHVVTTSFCFTGAVLENMKVRAGSTNSLSGGEVRDIARVIKHPDYVEVPRAADIAITVLSAPLFMTSAINALFLPAQNQYIADYTSVKIVSWGFESEQGPQLEQLKTVNLLKIPLLECQERYSDVDDVAIDDPVLCVGDQGAQGMCMGDSGAPMAIGQVLVGVSSFYKGCGDPTFPDVFTRIDRYTDWILEVATAANVRANVSAVRTSPVVSS
ncbi:trypsin, alkaline B-like [Cydia pomonella]|uniref:trypsin, alkaline B-like n=1 Tax=Cydia pomonella TaxID=82600 RepID=UPI002ADE6F7D|nr:trypsin, alkaline B-like [Cydia pomonella]